MRNCLNDTQNLYKLNVKISYESFNTFEQEIIYCLLNSYITDKEIESYLTRKNNNKIKGNVKYTIAMLYLKFETNSRTDLIRILRFYNFDKYVPISLFPQGSLIPYYN